MEYVAWVPCLSGNIYFHEVSPGVGDFDIYTYCIALPHNEYEFVVSSVVDWRDNPNPTLPKQNFFRVVLIAKRTEAGTLYGSIFVLDRTPDEVSSGHPDYELNRRPFFGKNSYLEIKLIRHLEMMENGDSDIPIILKMFSESSGCVLHKTNFSMTLSGLTTFKYETSRSIRGAIYSPTQNNIDIIVRQSFIYLKSCIHKHVHHEKQNDCFTETHRSTGNRQEDALLLLGDLKKGLSQIRNKYKRSFHSYSGICVYGFSLIATLKRNGWIEGHELIEREEKYLQNLQNSIEIMGLCKKSESDGLLADFIKYFNSTSLYALAVVGPTLFFLNTASTKSDYALRHAGEMATVCDGLNYLKTSCQYLYTQAADYSGGTFIPIFKVLLLMFILVTFVSVMRIGGVEYRKGGRISDTLITGLRHRAYAHKGFFGNTSYKLIRVLMGLRLWLPMRKGDGFFLQLFKLAIPLISFVLAFILLKIGLDFLGGPIPDSN